MTPKEHIEESKKIQEAATDGPWIHDGRGYLNTTEEWASLLCIRNMASCEDFNFIAQSRTRWPRETKALDIAVKTLSEECTCDQWKIWGKECPTCHCLKQISKALGEK